MLPYLLLYFVQFRDNLIFSVSCQGSESEGMNVSGKKKIKIINAESVRQRAGLTEIGDDTAVFLHCVFEPLQGVIDGGEGEDDL